jgi:hypothetical protein
MLNAPCQRLVSTKATQNTKLAAKPHAAAVSAGDSNTPFIDCNKTSIIN